MDERQCGLLQGQVWQVRRLDEEAGSNDLHIVDV